MVLSIGDSVDTKEHDVTMSQTQRHLLEQVTGLIDHGQNLQVDIPFDTGLFTLEAEQLAAIRVLVDQSVSLLDRIGHHFEADLDKSAGPRADSDIAAFSLADIAADISTELATREVADLAFIGRNDLQDMSRELDAARDAESFWRIASAADGALGRVGRALVPIETALREYEGLPPMRRRWEDLDDSLEVRRQYGMLWRTVGRLGNPDDERLPWALAKVAQRIAILRQHAIYPFLRIDDRWSIRKLQTRVLAHLAHGDEADPVAGRRLWSDLVSTFRLLMQINNRQELRDHDRDLVLAGCVEVRRSRQAPTIPNDLLAKLEPLLGRDDTLDQVLLRPKEFRPADCLAPLDRLREELLASSSTALQI